MQFLPSMPGNQEFDTVGKDLSRTINYLIQPALGIANTYLPTEKGRSLETCIKLKPCVDLSNK